MRTNNFVSNDPEVLGGQTVFAGTRVPLDIVRDYRLEGVAIEEFLANYPRVAEWRARKAWDLSREELAALIGRGGATYGEAD